MADSALRRPVWPLVLALVLFGLAVVVGRRVSHGSAALGRLTGGATTVSQAVVVEQTRAVARLVTSETMLRDVVVYQNSRLGSTKRSLVVVFSDMLGRGAAEQEAALAALQHLRHQHHEVLLFHVLDRATEANFDFQDRPYIFEDVETGQEIRLQPAQVREQYRAAMRQFEEDLALRCGQLKIDFVPVDVREPFDKVLYAYLVKRGKAR